MLHCGPMHARCNLTRTKIKVMRGILFAAKICMIDKQTVYR